MKIIYLFLIILFIPTILKSQNNTLSKFSTGSSVSNYSLLYALPRTGLHVTLEITRIIIKKGPYAEYAQKYLGLTNASLTNSESWQLSGANIIPINEADPDYYYSLYFKTFPENINLLLTLDNRGILLDVVESSGKYIASDSSTIENLLFDPYFIDEALKEKIDTLYKTVMNDSAFVRIPVFKKQILAKTQEELAKETAHQLIKTRKRRLKLIRGEYDFHPDAATIKVMIDEMEKQEEKYLALFRGIQMEKKYIYRFTIFPTKDLSNIDLGFLNKEKGFSKNFMPKSQSFSVQFIKSDSQTFSNTLSDKKSSNQYMLFYRVPSVIIVSLMSNQDEVFKMRVPFYQFGPIQAIPLKLK